MMLKIDAPYIQSRLAPILLIVTAIILAEACAVKSHPGNIPIRTPKNVPLVEAQLDQSGPLLFLLDTGVDPSVIDIETARAHNIPVDESVVGEAAGSGDGKGLAVMRSSIDRLVINGHSYDQIDALAADLSPFSKALDVSLAGILGHSFLTGRIIRIDYPAKEIAIATDAEQLPPSTTRTNLHYAVPLRFNSEDDRIPVFDISVRGMRVAVSLDTGKSSGVEFFQSATDRLGLEDAAQTGAAESRLGARGARQVTAGELDRIRLGPFNVENAKVSFSNKLSAGELREGNAGNAFLQGFVVTINYATGSISFEQ